ncbi:MAG: hypothetical protein FD169_2526 [Bacillota bacterium]|nr:MAG: hypothetical protein FD169_2526 [Bacillota bacterium]
MLLRHSSLNTATRVTAMTILPEQEESVIHRLFVDFRDILFSLSANTPAELLQSPSSILSSIM